MYENNLQTEQVAAVDTKTTRKFDITIKDTVFAILFVACSIILSAFGIFGGFRAGFTVATILLLTVITFYLKTKEIKISAYSVVCFLVSLGLSVNFSITSNSSVRFWSFVLLAILQLIWFTSLVSGDRAKGDLGILQEIVSPVFNLAIPNLPNAIASLFSGRKNKNLSKIFLGIVTAIPVLIVVVPLLMSSDQAFEGLVSLVFENMALLIVKIILGIIISAFLIAYCFSLKKDKLPQIKSSHFKGLENTVTLSFLSVLSVCYLSYLFSQLAYFFSAFSGFLPQNYEFSVSAYARRGFFEMSLIAAINFAIIFIVLLLSRKKKEKINLASRILCTFIGIFTLIIIATALSKMVLYIKGFGMTELRITTSVFMIFLAIVFIALMIRLYAPSIKVIKIGLIVAGTALIILGTVNVNAVIAKYNYTAYKNGILTDIDVSTIYNLGDEGIPYLAELINDNNETVAHLAKLKLSSSFADYYKIEHNDDNKLVEIVEKKYTGIGKFSFSRSQAYKVLQDVLEKEPEIVNYKTQYSENEYSENEYIDDEYIDNEYWGNEYWDNEYVGI